MHPLLKLFIIDMILLCISGTAAYNADLHEATMKAYDYWLIWVAISSFAGVCFATTVLCIACVVIND